LGEVVNVGVLLIFPDTRQLSFLYPERLGRIRRLYPVVSESVIRSYLKSIALRTRKLNRSPELFVNYTADLTELIDNELLIRDGSALQFGDIHSSVLYTDDLEAIVKQFYGLYLSFYNEEATPQVFHNEQYLLKTFKARLFEQLRGRLSTEIPDNPVTVQPPGLTLSYSFSFAWQNGTYNLLKTVSFDLKEEQSITDKATLNVGQFIVLQPYAEARKARFDLLLARPQNRAFFSQYDQALKLLASQPNVRVVEEEDLADYAQKTADALAE
jgi:hypothetical protein